MFNEELLKELKNVLKKEKIEKKDLEIIASDIVSFYSILNKINLRGTEKNK